jgi:hypothetical protein
MAGRTKLMMLLSGGVTTAVVQASGAGSRLGPSTAVLLGVGLVGLIVVAVVVGLVLASDKAADNLVRIIAMVRGLVPKATSLSRRSNGTNGSDRGDPRGSTGHG